jgi:hypothetical protein
VPSQRAVERDEAAIAVWWDVAWLEGRHSGAPGRLAVSRCVYGFSNPESQGPCTRCFTARCEPRSWACQAISAHWLPGCDFRSCSGSVVIVVAVASRTAWAPTLSVAM